MPVGYVFHGTQVELPVCASYKPLEGGWGYTHVCCCHLHTCYRSRKLTMLY
jgi:hypothetical protein